jgi:serine/tyrosine/threonine adenylyltransferase
MDQPLPVAAPIADFSNSYAELPPQFFVRQTPAQVTQPELIVFNEKLGRELGLDIAAITATGAAGIFSGNILPPGADPIAQAYAGHQFGNFVPQLGDGRAILLGEVIDRSGIRRDIQLKGAGRTAFSRGGDGRAALGPVLREYLMSEAMAALGVPTTRALAAVRTGEAVMREQALPGAVVTRVLASNIRVGTFQYFAARGDADAVKTLADYAIQRHYPALRQAENPYLALLGAVVEKQAYLIARWLQIGFIHGVMNTDNMTISGETIDYGPCAFLDDYDPTMVFSSIDQQGRYAFGNQPSIAYWNLARLAETLLSLLDADENRAVELATEKLQEFPAKFESFYLAGMRSKIGLQEAQEGDAALLQNLLNLMQTGKADFTLLFRRLADIVETGSSSARDLFENPASFDDWAAGWSQRLAREPMPEAARAAAMRQVNPAVIPRNYLVEEALAAAVSGGDLQPFNALLEVLQHPFEEQSGKTRYSERPPANDALYRTFCGT